MSITKTIAPKLVFSKKNQKDSDDFFERKLTLKVKETTNKTFGRKKWPQTSATLAVAVGLKSSAMVCRTSTFGPTRQTLALFDNFHIW